MKLICANFKMNLLKQDIKNYLKVINNNVDKNNIIFFPNNLHISYFKNNNYLVGSQDISFKEFGSVTGDTSIKQLKELGITHTIIGHSERREFFNDSKYVNKKIKLAFENDIKVILCIGEKEVEKKNKITNDILKNQLDEAIKDNLDLITNNNLIIAYEPIWAIGTGLIPTNKELENNINFIKNYLQLFNLNLKVLYGGSVNLDNIQELENISNIDGYLVGGCSLKPENIIALEKVIQK